MSDSLVSSYKSELCFSGRIYREHPDGSAAANELRATWIVEAATSEDDGWVYADAGDTYSGMRPTPGRRRQLPHKLVPMKCWFGCYYWKGEYCYQIVMESGTELENHFAGYRLDVSRHGYVGLYSGGPLFLGEGPMWKLNNLNPLDLKAGSRVSSVAIISPSGAALNRLSDEGFPYLNNRDGEPARFTIVVDSVNAPGLF